ncbi:MAG: hypothetical protein LC687_06370 [Actinobacteria bacterium]|nr:hypothetical protein [Actinomycetota bacterium]
MTTARTRTRNRRIETEQQDAGPTASMKEAARTYFAENTVSNTHKRAADKARKQLLVEMADAKQEPFTFTTTIDGKRHTLDVAVDQGAVLEVDVAKLKTLVDDKTFMAIISATKGAIVKQAGTVIADQCTKSVPGPTNAFVKVSK